jgi:hypothetical protein
MILFTGGFPFAGKSEFVRLLLTKLDPADVTVIEPKEFYPQGYDKLPADAQTRIAIAAWDVCIEKLNELILSESPDHLIIFDTAAKRLHHMRPLFVQSQVRGHRIFYVFIGASVDDCKRRGGNRWKANFEDDYSGSFEATVPALKRMADHFTVVVNKDDPKRTELNKAATTVAQAIIESKR